MPSVPVGGIVKERKSLCSGLGSQHLGVNTPSSNHFPPVTFILCLIYAIYADKQRFILTLYTDIHQIPPEISTLYRQNQDIVELPAKMEWSKTFNRYNQDIVISYIVIRHDKSTPGPPQKLLAWHCS